jgi:hypothetical protein
MSDAARMTFPSIHSLAFGFFVENSRFCIFGNGKLVPSAVARRSMSLDLSKG